MASSLVALTWSPTALNWSCNARWREALAASAGGSGRHLWRGSTALRAQSHLGAAITHPCSLVAGQALQAGAAPHRAAMQAQVRRVERLTGLVSVIGLQRHRKMAATKLTLQLAGAGACCVALRREPATAAQHLSDFRPLLQVRHTQSCCCASAYHTETQGPASAGSSTALGGDTRQCKGTATRRRREVKSAIDWARCEVGCLNEGIGEESGRSLKNSRAAVSAMPRWEAGPGASGAHLGGAPLDGEGVRRLSLPPGLIALSISPFVLALLLPFQRCPRPSS